MSKFCGKCGSKIDESSGLCSNCDIKNNVEKSSKSVPEKSLLIKILLPIFALVILAVGFFAMDYFEVAGTGVCKNLGLKPMGTFELYSDSDFVFATQDTEQKIRFFCSPEKGYIPQLTGDITAVFFDDGNSSVTYDAVKKDGVFTAEVNVKESDIKTISVYAIAKNGLAYYQSNTIEIEVREDWTEEDYSAVEYVDNELRSLMLGETYTNESTIEKFKSIKQLLTELDEQGKIKKDTLYFDTEYLTVSFEHLNGAWASIDLSTFNSDDVLFGESVESSNIQEEQDDSNEEINSSNTQALIIYDWYTDKPEIQKFYEDYKNEWDNKGLSTTLRVNPSVEQYATDFANKDLVLIAAHGGRYPVSRGWFKKPNIYSTVCSNVKSSKEMDKKYKTEISSKNMVYSYLNDGKDKVYAFLPSFFSSHYNRDGLNNTILLMDNCNGMGSNGDIDYDLSSSLTGDNSATVGFHNSVCIFKSFDRTNDTYYALGYGTNFMKSIADYLLNGLTFSEAYEKTEKIYGSNQKQYMDDFWESGNDEDEKVFPMISGNGNAKLALNIEKNANDFVVSNKLVKVGSKYIVSDTTGIYLKNSILESGKKIVSMENTGHMMTDGEVLYFSVKANTQQSNDAYYEPYDIYSVNIDGSDLKLVYKCEHMVNFVTCYNDYLYYMDLKFESASFNKINLADSNNTILISGNNPYCDHGKVFGNKVYLSRGLQDISQITENKVYSFDLKTEAIEIVANDVVLPNDFYNVTDRVYMTSFKYSFSGSVSHYYDSYIYYIDNDGNLKTSAKLPDDCSVSYLHHDASYAILYKFEKNNTSKVWYRFELSTGKYDEISNLNNMICFERPDFKDYEDIYFIQYPNNFTGSSVSIHVAKLENNSLTPLKIGGDSYYKVNSEYWVIDGFFVDDRFQCFELS